MRNLVTGGAGFIGRHLVRALLHAGQQVLVLDDFSTGRRDPLPTGAEQIEGDVRAQPAVDALVASTDRVFHLAAAVGTQVVAEDPAGTWTRNVQGTATVLEAAATHGRPLVFASSSEVYGPRCHSPLREEDPSSLVVTGRREIYALSKAAGEAYALALGRAKALSVVVARLFNVVGAGQAARYGMVLPRFVTAAQENRPLTVYGDGSQRRCFLHVQDAVRALVSLADALPDVSGRVFNVGSAQEIRILDLARRVTEEAGRGRIEHVPFDTVFGRDFVDPQRRVPDVGRLESLMGQVARQDLGVAIRDLLAAGQASSPAGLAAAISPPKLSATARSTQRSTSPKA